MSPSKQTKGGVSRSVKRTSMPELLRRAEVEAEHGIEQIVGSDGAARVAWRWKRRVLGGDLGDAGEFLLGEQEVGSGLGGQRLLLEEIDEVGDGFERIIDLVRDGGGEAADGGEFFAADEGGLGLLLVREVGAEDGDLRRRRRCAEGWLRR